jgi:pyrroline-5-carboxylate reductase
MRILFVGGGNMATALIGGLLAQGLAARDLEVVDISPEVRSRLAGRGVRAVADLSACSGAFDVIVLAVKPQQIAPICKAVGPMAGGALIVSIAAGIRTGDLVRWLGGHRRLVRAMPNTPALIGAGITGLYAASEVTDADRGRAHRILGAVGSVLWFEREALLDVVTAVSGSGPAYVFYFIEALEEAGRSLGIEPAAARRLAIETFAGAAGLAARGEDPPAMLRGKVTSKGGTTECALQALDASRVKEHIIAAVKAASERAREMGDEFGKS